MDCYNRDLGAYAGRDDWLDLYTLADLHFGARACSESHIRAAVATVAANPHARWLGGGDFFDSILPGDKRFDMRHEKALDLVMWNDADRDIARYQTLCKARLLEILDPIADKCLGLLVGNHEETAAARGQVAFLHDLVQLYRHDCNLTKRTPNMNFDTLGYVTVLLLHFQRKGSGARQEVVVFATHGTGASATAGGRLNKLESVLSWMPGAHLYVCFHFHDTVVHPRAVFDIVHGPRPFIQERKCHVLIAPSTMRTYADGYDSYAAKRLYPPSVLGIGHARIYPFGDRLKADGRDTTRPRIEIIV